MSGFLTTLFGVATDLKTTETEDDGGVLEDLPDPRLGMLTRIFEEHKPAGMTVLVSQVVAEVDGFVSHIDNPHWTSKEASKKKIRQSLRRVFRKYKLPVDGEPFESAWAYILKHY